MSLKKMMNFIKFHFFSNKFKISQINVKKKKSQINVFKIIVFELRKKKKSDKRHKKIKI